VEPINESVNFNIRPMSLTDNGAAARTDSREVVNLLTRMRDRTADLTPTMQAIGAFYERRVIENFKNQSAPDSTPWQPLSEVTLHMGLAKNKGRKKNGYLSAKGTR